MLECSKARKYDLQETFPCGLSALQPRGLGAPHRLLLLLHQLAEEVLATIIHIIQIVEHTQALALSIVKTPRPFSCTCFSCRFGFYHHSNPVPRFNLFALGEVP